MTYGPAVAEYARSVLTPGPMSRTVRSDDYRAFIDANFFDSPQAPVFHSQGTNCAIFARGCLVGAGVKPKGRRPAVTGITSWLGVGWFLRPEWHPFDDLELQPGDVLYWCGSPGMTVVQWHGATNGHVGIILEADGWMAKTAEGGGGDGSNCRMSDEPKDVRLSHGRPLRGIWRPDDMLKPEAHVTPAKGTPLTLRMGDHSPDVGKWQDAMKSRGYSLPLTFKKGKADQSFGNETETATKAFQRASGLPVTGVVDSATWTALAVGH